MGHNFFLTNSESQNLASATAQQVGIGAVLVLGTESISNDSYVLGTSDSMSIINGLGLIDKMWTFKVLPLEGYDGSMTYADTGIENTLLSTGVIFYSDLLPVGVFGISLPSFVPNQEKAVLSYIANVLREHGHFATVVISDGSSNDSKTFTEDL